jgi:ketosteroid isomerase-like protein
MSDESDVRDLEKKRIDAIVNRKQSVLEAIFDDTITHVRLNGVIENKAQAIENIMTKTQFLALEWPDLKVRLFGDTAVLTGLHLLHAKRPDGSEVHLKATGIQVARKTPQGWKFVAYQVTTDATQK